MIPNSLEIAITETKGIRLNLEGKFLYTVDTVYSDVHSADQIIHLITLNTYKEKPRIKILRALTFRNNCDSFDVTKSADIQMRRLYDLGFKSNIIKEIDRSKDLYILFYNKCCARMGMCVGDKYLFIDFENFKDAAAIKSISNNIKVVSY